MKKIKIAHLYYDLMNLYGEVGNVRALETFIRRQGVDVEVSKLTLGDERIDFSKYDIVYIGSGSEDSQELAMAHLARNRDSLVDAIEDGKMFIVTGNAMEMFGSSIRENTGKIIKCLNILKYNANENSENMVTDTRIVTEIMYEFEELEEDKGRDIVGFKNCRCNIVNNDEDRLFGFSDNVRHKNFFGMMFFGPVLIRNPYFTDYLLKILFDDLGLEYKESCDSIEYKAYHEFLKNFKIN